MTLFTLGINTGFAVNRFPEPEVWGRLVAQEFHLESVQLVADLLNPFWPREVLDAEVERIRLALDRYHLNIHSLMTSAFTRVNHFLHPYPEHRQTWRTWFRRFAELAARLNARAVGSHFGILSVHDVELPARRRERIREAVLYWQELTHYAQELGLEFIFFETMSIPREMAWTISEAKELLARVNEDAGVPMYLCLDVGHAPHPQERDPYLWLRELAQEARIVHLQQTEWGHSRHWPFTPEYNARGIIDPPRVLEALRQGGAKEIFLAFEISHRERYEVEPRVIPDLRASVEYWQKYLGQERQENE